MKQTSLPIDEQIGDLAAEVGILRAEVAATIRVVQTQTEEISVQLRLIERLTNMLVVLAKDYAQRKGG